MARNNEKVIISRISKSNGNVYSKIIKSAK